MKRVKGSDISKKLPPMYTEEYFWRERNSRDDPIDLYLYYDFADTKGLKPVANG